MKIFTLKNSQNFSHAVLTIENQDYTKLNKINSLVFNVKVYLSYIFYKFEVNQSCLRSDLE